MIIKFLLRVHQNQNQSVEEFDFRISTEWTLKTLEEKMYEFFLTRYNERDASFISNQIVNSSFSSFPVDALVSDVKNLLQVVDVNFLTLEEEKEQQQKEKEKDEGEGEDDVLEVQVTRGRKRRHEEMIMKIDFINKPVSSTI